MNELIQQLTTKAGLTEEQAQKALDVIADYVKEKFPMAGGMMDNFMKSNGDGGSGFNIPGL